MHQDSPSLVKFRLDKRNGGNEVLQDVGVSGIVEVDLVSDEGLFCSMSGGCSPKQHRMAYLVDRDTSAHRGQDASDVVRAKGLGVECTREIPNPQMGHDLVHRHSVVVWMANYGGAGVHCAGVGKDEELVGGVRSQDEPSHDDDRRLQLSCTYIHRPSRCDSLFYYNDCLNIISFDFFTFIINSVKSVKSVKSAL